MDRSERNRESVTVDDAIRRILTGCVALAARSVPLLEARDQVLAENIFASSDSPRFDTVAMDGYAVQEADIRGATQDRPVKLGVVGSLLAGSPQDLAVAPGTAVRVMTGAEVPTDADVVIPFEEVESGEGLIVVRQSQATGTNIRRKGEDIAAGTLLLEPGVVLSPAHLALIASEGIAAVDVRPRPRVSVIATGDELIAPGEALAPGQIWDSNSVMVAALISQFGGDVTLCTRTRDEAGEALALIRKAVADGSDLIVTIGGASRGDRDVLSEIAADGISLDYWDVRMKPGRPLVFGSVDGIPVMGLPGNPAAAFVSAIQFVRPAILTMNGRLDIEPPVIEARVTEQIANPGGKRAFYRVTLARDDSGPVARPAGRQNVANLATLARADGLLVIPESMSTVDPGTRLPVQVIRDL